jgi:hypothetical protein
MINLINGLPNTIEVDGKPYHIYTDYRVWLKFGQTVANGESDFSFIFVKETPLLRINDTIYMSDDCAKALVNFYLNENELPRDSKTNVRAIDFEIDSELIYAAMLQQYGIDIFETGLHWHKFKALISALTEKTLLGQVMGWRNYEGKEKEICKLREVWALPEILTEEEKEMLDKFERNASWQMED